MTLKVNQRCKNCNLRGLNYETSSENKMDIYSFLARFDYLFRYLDLKWMLGELIQATF